MKTPVFTPTAFIKKFHNPLAYHFYITNINCLPSSIKLNYTTAAIAGAFCLSEHAINKRRMKLMRDCGVKTPIELAQHTLEAGAIDWRHLFK